MSIIKRKAGCEDIVKSILEFDAVPTEGSPNLVESGSVAQAIGNLGQPLQWKGPATVAQLNAGITGIQPGWTYTLTDAGTLTYGSVAVDVGDEVAWTEDGEWFKLGGDQLVKTEAIAPEFSEEGSYAVGDLVTHDGKLYSSLSIQSAVVWDDSNWSETSVAAQIGNVEALLAAL